MIATQNRKSYLENRKSYEFLNAIFEFRLKDLFWKSWIKIEHAFQKNLEGFCFEILDQDRSCHQKIKDAISRTVRATNF